MKNLLRHYRDAYGISQEDMRQATGIGLATISRIENGHTVPRASTKKKIAHYLGVSVRQVFPVRGIR